MDLDDVTLELRTRELVRLALSEFPLLESDPERVRAARRVIRHAGKETCHFGLSPFRPVTGGTSTDVLAAGIDQDRSIAVRDP